MTQENIDWMDLSIKVVNIEGTCPVYKVGDTFHIDSGYKINVSKSCDICVHALGSIMTFMIPLSAGLPLEDLGLGHGEQGKAHVRCLDPGPPLTEGGAVTFEITREKHKKDE